MNTGASFKNSAVQSLSNIMNMARMDARSRQSHIQSESEFDLKIESRGWIKELAQLKRRKRLYTWQRDPQYIRVSCDRGEYSFRNGAEDPTADSQPSLTE
jgi:hypothetical protein